MLCFLASSCPQVFHGLVCVGWWMIRNVKYVLHIAQYLSEQLRLYTIYNWQCNHTKPLTCCAPLLSQCNSAGLQKYIPLIINASAKQQITKTHGAQEYPKHLEMHISFVSCRKQTISEVVWFASVHGSTHESEQRLRLRERQSLPSADPQSSHRKRWTLLMRLHFAHCITRSRNTHWPQSVIYFQHTLHWVVLPQAINKALMTKAI